MIQRVRAVLRRSDNVSLNKPKANEEGASIKRGKLTLDPARYLCQWSEKPIPVTVTEFLLILAQNIKVIFLSSFLTVFFTFTYIQFILIPEYVSTTTLLLPESQTGKMPLSHCCNG